MLASSGYRQRRAGLGSLGWDGVRRAWMDGMRRSLPVGRRRGMGLGAEDRDRGSGGDQLERQSGRALALSGGGGGGGGRDGHGRRELGAGWGLLETCHAGTGLAVRRGTSDRPLIGYPWHPHGTPNQGTHLQKAQGWEQGSERHDSGAFETDRPHMHNGIMDVKRAPFPSPLFSTVSRDMPATSRYRYKMEGVRHQKDHDASFTWSHLVTTGLGRIPSFDFDSKDSESHYTAGRQKLHHGSNAGSAKRPECWYFLIFC